MNPRCSAIAAGLALVAMVAYAGNQTLEPPRNASHLCGGHVTGAPLPDGRPGPHIIWEAYSSRESPAVLAKRYLESLGSEAHEKMDGCDLWRFPPDKPAHTLEVCPVSSGGPWSECSKAPRTAASIIMISSIARAD